MYVIHHIWGVRCVVVNKIIKGSFALVGLLTGFTLTKTVLLLQNFGVSGNIYEVADVVKSLMLREKEKGLSTGERKMLNSARQILISELVLAKGINPLEVEGFINTNIKI